MSLKYDDVILDLAGGAWEGCTFTKCVIILNRTDQATTIVNCHFELCTFEGNGWPIPVLIANENGLWPINSPRHRRPD